MKLLKTWIYKSVLTIDIFRVYSYVILKLLSKGTNYLLKIEYFKKKSLLENFQVNPNLYVNLAFMWIRRLNKFFFLFLSSKYKSTCFIRAVSIFYLSVMYNQYAILNIAIPKIFELDDFCSRNREGHCWTTIMGEDYDCCPDYWIVVDQIESDKNNLVK